MSFLSFCGFMLELRLRGFHIRIYFGFFAVLLFGLLLRRQLTRLLLAGILLHECGHIFPLLLFGCKISGLTASAMGIRLCCISPPRRTAHELAIILGGSAVNLFCALLNHGTPFGTISLVLGLYSLLPFEGLDGGAFIRFKRGEPSTEEGEKYK